MPFAAILQDQVTVRSLRPQLVRADGSVVFQGEVLVTYGASRITADRVVLSRDQGRGVAEGNVPLTDPDGTAQATRIEFRWGPPRGNFLFGSGENVTIRVANALLRARRATFEPNEWTLLDVEATTCLRPTPVYLVTSEKLIVRPGRQVVVQEPRVSLFGRFIAELPTQRAALTPAVPGLRFPSPSYKLGQGFGLTWNGGVFAGHDAAFTFNARSFQGAKPSALVLYTKSFLPIREATQIVAPRTDFAERFNFGYMDTVQVETPEQEQEFLRARRSSVSGGGQLNGSIADRERGTRYSKVEGVYEIGGGDRGFGLLGQARVQGLQREGEGMEPRLTLYGSLGLPSLRLARGLGTLARIDSAGFTGRTAFGWTRAMIGLTYAPTTWLRLSAAGFVSGEAGTPQFDIDPLYAKNGTLLRADVAFGGLRFSYLTKSDHRRGVYDHEIAINQVIGCVEAFYVQREYPNDRRIGLTLRIQPLIDLFRRRGGEFQNRQGAVPAPANPGSGAPRP